MSMGSERQATWFDAPALAGCLRRRVHDCVATARTEIAEAIDNSDLEFAAKNKLKQSVEVYFFQPQMSHVNVYEAYLTRKAAIYPSASLESMRDARPSESNSCPKDGDSCPNDSAKDDDSCPNDSAFSQLFLDSASVALREKLREIGSARERLQEARAARLQQQVDTAVQQRQCQILRTERQRAEHALEEITLAWTTGHEDHRCGTMTELVDRLRVGAEQAEAVAEPAAASPAPPQMKEEEIDQENRAGSVARRMTTAGVVPPPPPPPVGKRKSAAAGLSAAERRVLAFRALE